MNYASVNNNIISALLNGSFKFPNRENAQKFLERLQKQFILAKGHEELIKEGKLRFWIKGYKITVEEQEQGGIGNFCIVTVHEMPDGTNRIIAEKEAVDIGLHPSKKRKAARMPNFGHPVLRLAKKGHEYEKFQEAAEVLLDLHNEFPDTTIPNKDRLDLMIYSRDKAGGKPKTLKMRLQIKPVGEKFTITLEEKDSKPLVAKEEKQVEESDVKGKFTAMAMLKQRKKKK